MKLILMFSFFLLCCCYHNNNFLYPRENCISQKNNILQDLKISLGIIRLIPLMNDGELILDKEHNIPIFIHEEIVYQESTELATINKKLEQLNQLEKDKIVKFLLNCQDWRSLLEDKIMLTQYYQDSITKAWRNLIFSEMREKEFSKQTIDIFKYIENNDVYICLFDFIIKNGVNDIKSKDFLKAWMIFNGENDNPNYFSYIPFKIFSNNLEYTILGKSIINLYLENNSAKKQKLWRL